ncbi:biliverdin-producing heme oxygenase [Ramlibacter henchirensis]|nr:biliverdin-producing heme oxygenase [Ramlibacter henchirensis]
MAGPQQYTTPLGAPVASINDTLASLRQATAGQHARIESLVGLGGPFGRGHYGRVLQGFGAFLHGWEPAVARTLPRQLLPWFARGRRAFLIDRDLAALGLPALGPEAAVVPHLEDRADALGSLYVMEGAALGGQLIAANLRHRLRIDADNGGAYFNGCGSGTAARWREYRSLAQSQLEDDARARARAADAAVRTFEALIATFETLLDERAAA